MQFCTALRIKCFKVWSHATNLKLLSKKRRAICSSFLYLAERTGLEPATPGVTGRYSNQLNYHSETTKNLYCLTYLMVGAERLELPTYAL